MFTLTNLSIKVVYCTVIRITTNKEDCHGYLYHKEYEVASQKQLELTCSNHDIVGPLTFEV